MIIPESKLITSGLSVSAPVLLFLHLPVRPSPSTAAPSSKILFRHEKQISAQTEAAAGSRQVHEHRSCCSLTHSRHNFIFTVILTQLHIPAAATAGASGGEEAAKKSDAHPVGNGHPFDNNVLLHFNEAVEALGSLSPSKTTGCNENDERCMRFDKKPADLRGLQIM